MNAFDCTSDGVIAGWLLVAETLVPTLFSLFRPAFRRSPSVDLRYLDEHIAVDSDEHARWMHDAALEIAQTEGGFRSVIQGIHLGGRATLSVPDALFSKTVRLEAAGGIRMSA